MTNETDSQSIRSISRPAKDAQVAQWLVVAVLLVALFPMQYGYYTFVRWATTLAAIWITLRLWPTNSRLKFAFVAVAIAFNPIAPLYFSRATWRFLDAGTAILFAIAAIRSSRTGREIGAVNEAEDGEAVRVKR